MVFRKLGQVSGNDVFFEHSLHGWTAVIETFDDRFLAFKWLLGELAIASRRVTELNRGRFLGACGRFRRGRLLRYYFLLYWNCSLRFLSALYSGFDGVDLGSDLLAFESSIFSLNFLCLSLEVVFFRLRFCVGWVFA